MYHVISLHVMIELCDLWFLLLEWAKMVKRFYTWYFYTTTMHTIWCVPYKHPCPHQSLHTLLNWTALWNTNWRSSIKKSQIHTLLQWRLQCRNEQMKSLMFLKWINWCPMLAGEQRMVPGQHKLLLTWICNISATFWRKRVWRWKKELTQFKVINKWYISFHFSRSPLISKGLHLMSLKEHMWHILWILMVQPIDHANPHGSGAHMVPPSLVGGPSRIYKLLKHISMFWRPHWIWRPQVNQRQTC